MSERTSHVGVIGAGVIGLSIASELLDRGHKVTCIAPLSRDNVSASLASGAMLGAFGEITSRHPHDKFEAETALRVESALMYPAWLDALHQQTGTKVALVSGTFIIGNSASSDDGANIAEIERQCGLYGAPFQWVDKSDCPGLNPHPNYEPHKIIFLPNESFVKSSDLIGALRKKCIMNASFIMYNDEVIRVEEHGKRIKTKNTGYIECDHAVVAAGAATLRLIADDRDIIKEIPRVIKGKGSYIKLRADKSIPFVIRTPNRDFACGLHLVPQGGSNMYLGATNRIELDDDFASAPSLAELQSLMFSGSHEINTSMRRWSFESAGSGGRPSSLDGKMLLGTLDGRSISIATGTYRNGVLLAPKIATLLADEIETGKICSEEFGPRGRAEAIIPTNISKAVRQAFDDLVQYILEPGGFIPYDRQEMLAKYMANTFMSLLDKSQRYEIIEELIVDYRKSYHAELIPNFFEKLANLD